MTLGTIGGIGDVDQSNALAVIVQDGGNFLVPITSTTIDFDLLAVTKLLDGSSDFTSDNLGKLTYTGPGIKNVKIMAIASFDAVTGTIFIIPKIFVNTTRVSFGADNTREQPVDQVAHPIFAVTDLITGDVISTTVRNNTNTTDVRQRDLLVWVMT